MQSHLNDHFRNLFPIFVDILEHYVAQLTGDRALERLRRPYEEEDAAQKRAAERIARFVCALNKTQEQFHQLREVPSANLQVESEFVHILESFEQEIDVDKLTTSLTPLLDEELAGQVAQALGRNLVACSDSSLTERYSAIKLDEILDAVRESIRSAQSGQAQHTQIEQESLDVLRRIKTLLEQLLEARLPLPEPPAPTPPAPAAEWQVGDFKGLKAFEEASIGGLLEKLGLSDAVSPNADLVERKKIITGTLNDSGGKQAILTILPYILERENCKFLSESLRQFFIKLNARYLGDSEIKDVVERFCLGPVAQKLMDIINGKS